MGDVNRNQGCATKEREKPTPEERQMTTLQVLNETRTTLSEQLDLLHKQIQEERLRLVQIARQNFLKQNRKPINRT